MIKYCSMLLFLLLSLSVLAQQDPVLMRINGKKVLRSEFEYVYNKKMFVSSEQNTLKDYADRFVNFKLKVAAAEAMGLDSTQNFRDNLDEFRRQLGRYYLIDKEAEERTAHQYYNKMKAIHYGEQVLVSHIYKYIPQNVSNLTLHTIEARMDSIHEELKQGGDNVDFETYVGNLSDEKSSFWVSRLQMPTEFESIIFDMKVGDVSHPFFTPQGIHIVKVLDKKERTSFEEVKKSTVCKQTVSCEVDEGAKAAIERLKKEYCYKLDEAAVDELLTIGHTLRVLFTLADKAYTGKDFALFAIAHPKGTQRQLNEFIMKSILDYENGQLERKFPDFHLLMQVYRDSLLLEAISGNEVREQYEGDEASLKTYFEKHSSDYYWSKPRYKGIVLHCVSKRVAKKVRKFLKQIPEEEWQDAIRLTFNAGDESQVQSKQGLFAPGDDAHVDKLVFKGKQAPVVMSYPFTVVLGKKLKGPNDYLMVREQLSIDYLMSLEQRWIAELRASSKVEINQEVLKTVNNH